MKDKIVKVNLHFCPYRMIEIAKAMRLTLIRPPRAKGPTVELQDQHKQVSLVLPLVTCVPFKDRPKRRKLR